MVAGGDPQPGVAVDDLGRRATTETSARTAATRPAPTAGPCMAETIGLEQSSTLYTRSRASRITRVRTAKSPHDLLDQLEDAAGGETPAFAPEQHGSYAGVGVELAPHLGQIAVRPRAYRVQIRGIEHQLDDPRLVGFIYPQMLETRIAPHGHPHFSTITTSASKILYFKYAERYVAASHYWWALSWLAPGPGHAPD